MPIVSTFYCFLSGRRRPPSFFRVYAFGTTSGSRSKAFLSLPLFLIDRGPPASPPLPLRKHPLRYTSPVTLSDFEFFVFSHESRQPRPRPPNAQLNSPPPAPRPQTRLKSGNESAPLSPSKINRNACKSLQFRRRTRRPFFLNNKFDCLRRGGGVDDMRHKSRDGNDLGIFSWRFKRTLVGRFGGWRRGSKVRAVRHWRCGLSARRIKKCGTKGIKLKT